MTDHKYISKDPSALFTPNEQRNMATVTIPRSEYDKLVKKSLLLDMAILAKPASYGYEKEQVLNVAQEICAGGWLEC